MTVRDVAHSPASAARVRCPLCATAQTNERTEGALSRSGAALRRVERFDARLRDHDAGGEMTVFTLGPNENKDGPFAEVHARHEIDARRKVQSVDDRRNWLDLNAVYALYRGWRGPDF